LVTCHAAGNDVNRDGFPDVVCDFQNALTAFSPSDSTAVLRGKTVKGVSIEGRTAIRIVP
jgi:hypothetical protein